MKPGSCGPGVLGIYPIVYDEDGNEVPDGKAGNICIRNPWPGTGWAPRRSSRPR